MSLKPIDPKTLELNPFTTIGTEWMLLTAGNEDKHNTMTVSWGGLGVLWRKNVTYASAALYYGVYGSRRVLLIVCI